MEKTWFEQYKLHIGGALIIIIVLIGGGMMVQGANTPNSESVITSDQVKNDTTNTISEVDALLQFDIQGAVKNPGVYKLKPSSVIADAIKAAGGFSADADIERIAREINQASLIGDNAKIYIFKTSDRDVPVSLNGSNTVTTTAEQNASPTQTTGSKININTAPLTELDKLPGIGPAIGQRIIDYRNQNGRFLVIEDLKKVSGIGEALFEKIKGQIAV